MADNYVTWRDNVLYDSELFLEDLTRSVPDDTFGWGARFDALLNDRAELTGCGLLLTGPDGCGKHTAALHMITRLALQKFQIVFLDGAEFNGLEFSDAVNRMEALLEYFISMKKGLCICLEGMEDHVLRRELLRYLGHTLTVYRKERLEFPSLFLILIDGDVDSVPHLLRRKLLLCRMSYPDKATRKQFLTARASAVGERISLDLFAEQTEGASYRQMLDTLENLTYLVDSKEGVEKEEIVAFIAGQRPPVGELYQLSGMMAEFLEKLPEVLANSGGRGGYGDFEPTPNPVTNGKDPRDDERKYLADKRRELDNMPPKELAEGVFGEDDAKNLHQEIKERYSIPS